MGYTPYYRSKKNTSNRKINSADLKEPILPTNDLKIRQIFMCMQNLVMIAFTVFCSIVARKKCDRPNDGHAHDNNTVGYYIIAEIKMETNSELWIENPSTALAQSIS